MLPVFELDCSLGVFCCLIPQRRAWSGEAVVPEKGPEPFSKNCQAMPEHASKQGRTFFDVLAASSHGKTASELCQGSHYYDN